MSGEQSRILSFYKAVSGNPDAVKACQEMHAEPALSLADKEQKPEAESEQLRSEICRLRKEIEGLKSWLNQVRKENQQLKAGEAIDETDNEMSENAEQESENAEQESENAEQEYEHAIFGSRRCDAFKQPLRRLCVLARSGTSKRKRAGKAAEVRAAMAVEADAAVVARAAELKLVSARKDVRYFKNVSSSELSVLEQSVCQARADEEVAKARLSLLRAEQKAARCRHDSETYIDMD